MKQIVKNTFSIGALLTALAICAASASARGVAPFSGSKAQNPAESGGFTESGAGGVTNNCPGEKIIHIATPVDTHGGVWGYVTAYAATTENMVSCQMFAIDQWNPWYVSASPRLNVDRLGSFGSITMGGGDVPDLGAAYMACWLNQGGIIRSVSWGQ